MEYEYNVSGYIIEPLQVYLPTSVVVCGSGAGRIGIFFVDQDPIPYPLTKCKAKLYLKISIYCLSIKNIENYDTYYHDEKDKTIYVNWQGCE